MKVGVVKGVILDDDNADNFGSIIVDTTAGGIGSKIRCYPLNTNHRQIPILGEQVYVYTTTSDEASGLNGGTRNYYASIVSLQKNVNHNALPKSKLIEGASGGSEYGNVSSGIPQNSSTDSTVDFGVGFVEVSGISQLQPFLGDTIFEGRYGQSIRFGYTPRGVKTTNNKIKGARNEPSWSSTTPESPITIIRNGAGKSNGYNKYVIEDINKDDSSIWLGSKQKIGLTSSNKFTLGVVSTEQYQNPQIIINSERIVLNSKKDSVLISGAKSVNISTPNWKADMDKMFTQIEELKNQIQKLNTAVSLMGPAFLSAANAGGPVPSLTAIGSNITTNTSAISSKLVEITTQLQLMKQ
jgi:hypothetical protein